MRILCMPYCEAVVAHNFTFPPCILLLIAHHIFHHRDIFTVVLKDDEICSHFGADCLVSMYQI